MATVVRMPNLGTEATSGRIVSWLRCVGDAVHAGDVLVEVETDKASLELEAPAAGRLAKIVHDKGEDVAIGETIAVIEDA